MEVAFILALAAAGYKLSENSKTTSQPIAEPITERPKKYPFKHKPVVKPYFRSEKSQAHARDETSKRTLEAFSGLDSTWSHKKEVEPQFKPSPNVGFVNGWSQPLSEDFRTDRYLVTGSSKMDGVAPVEKQLVGRGLGISADVQAQGGFHDTLRILPSNVGEYKKNTLPGRMNIGKSVSEQPTSNPTIETTKNALDLVPRDVLPSKTDFNAPSAHSAYLFMPTTRDNCNDFNGNIGNQHAPQVTSSQQTRTFDSSICGNHGNPHQHGGASYNNSGTYIMSQEQRESCAPLINVNNSSYGSTVQYSQGAKPTMRESSSHNQGYISSLSAPSSTVYTANTTQRESENNYAAGPKYQVSSTYKLDSDNIISTTNRENTSSTFAGPAHSIHKTNMNQSNFQSANPYYKREDTSREYTPGASRMNITNNPESYNVELSNDSNHNVPNHPKGFNKTTSLSQYGNIESKHSENINQYLNLNIASQQLKNNPYNVLRT